MSLGSEQPSECFFSAFFLGLSVSIVEFFCTISVLSGKKSRDSSYLLYILEKNGKLSDFLGIINNIQKHNEMLKLPKSHKRTFDQIEYSRAINLLDRSYHTLSRDKIDEIGILSPYIALSEPYYGMTFDEARYSQSIKNLRNSYYSLSQDKIDRVKALAKDL